MKRVLYILILILLPLSVMGQGVYYVATDGSDSNAGSFAAPWLTWEYAFEQLSPGDSLYIRGGTYYKPDDGGAFWRNKITGTAEDSIYIFNYPGETPILDFSLISTDARSTAWGIVTETYYVHFKGLTMQNFYENDADDDLIMWQLYGNNTRVEQCVTRWGGGRSFRLYQADQFCFINCDAYMHVDSLSPELPGNDGYGFSASILAGDSVFYYGCRAWDNGDDGFTPSGEGYVEFENCWSFDNGELQGGGTGWKINGASSESTGINRKIVNCIAAYNADHGITTNDQTRYASGLNVFNNTFYHNGYQGTPYWGTGGQMFNSLSDLTREADRILKNNIFYDNERYVVWVESGSTYTHSYNDWDLPSVTITDADFLSLDSTGIRGARQADGSLPDIDFLKLTSTSDAIGAGDDEGYGTDLGGIQYSTQETPVLPTVTTGDAYSVGASGATIRGNNNDDGGGTVTLKGVCWNTTGTPTIADSKTNNGGGAGVFDAVITGLTVNTTYYIRAYATNGVGTAYGNQVSFTTTEKAWLLIGGKYIYLNGKLIKF